MDAQENREATRVGIFLAVGLVILVVGILTLGSLQKSFVRNIQLVAIFSDVGGLKKGNNIWFSGVKVGTIRSLRFAGVSQVVVNLSVEASVQQYIHRGAGVKISSDGIIGNKILIIDGGSVKAPVVETGDTLRVETGIGTEELLKTLQKNNENLLTITQNLKTITGQVIRGKGVLGTLLEDSIATAQIKAVLANGVVIAQRTSELARRVNQFSAKLGTKGGLADRLLTDTLIFSRVHQSAIRLNALTDQAALVIDGLKKTSDQLNTTHGVLGILLNDEKEALRMKSTLTNLNQSSVKLNASLEAVQHNFLLRGFFKRQEKNRMKDSLSRILAPSHP